MNRFIKQLLTFSLILTVMIQAVSPAMNQAYALVTINASISSDKILTWDPVPGAGQYWYGIDGTTWLSDTAENKLDLKEKIDQYVVPLNEGQDPLVENSGTHTITLEAYTADGSTKLGEWSGTVSYTAIIPEKPKLTASIKDGVLTWGEYEGATQYQIMVNGKGFGMEKIGSVRQAVLSQYVDDFVNNGVVANNGLHTITLTVLDDTGNPLANWTADFKYTTRSSLNTAVISAIPRQKYTGKSITPSVRVTLGNTTLKAGTDYTLSYKDNKKAGLALVTVTGKGTYSGAVQSSFLITPPRPKLSSVKNSAKKTVTVKWKKAASGDGYEIQYSLKKSMKNAKTIQVQKLSKKSQKLKKLKKGKTCYIRIRTYKEAAGTMLYSAWSGKKKVKIKK